MKIAASKSLIVLSAEHVSTVLVLLFVIEEPGRFVVATCIRNVWETRKRKI